MIFPFLQVAAISMRLLFLCSLSILSALVEGQEAGKKDNGKASQRQLLVASCMEWSTAFSLDGEHKLAKNSQLTTLAKLTKEWKVSFEVNPTDYSFRGYASVLHMTMGGRGAGSSAEVGDRTPAIWFHKTRGVMVSSALDGKASYSKFFRPLPLAGEWTKIEVSQSLVSSQYMYSIAIANKQVFTRPNKEPLELSDVKVFASNPWDSAQKGSIRNLKIEIMTLIDCVQTGEIPSLSCTSTFE